MNLEVEGQPTTMRPNQPLTYDECIWAIGGYGRYQFYVAITLILAFMTGGYIFYGLVFLQALPEYQCLKDVGGESEWKVCEKAAICDNDLVYETQWRINYDADQSYHNWVDPGKLDLTCVAPSTLGLMGSAYFLGFAISSGLAPPSSDRLGRKKPYFACLAFQTFAYILIVFSRNVNATIFYYLLVGLSAGGRVSIGVNYMNEYLPQKYINITTTMLNVGEACTMIFQSVIYYYGRSWLPIHIIGVVGAFVVMGAVWLIPESPKWLYANNRFDEARAVFKQIAKFNRATLTDSDIDNIVFDIEVENGVQPNEYGTPQVEEETPKVDSDAVSHSQSLLESTTIMVEGRIIEMCQYWQLRTNWICIFILLSSCSFCYFLINFYMDKIKGTLVRNTLSSQFAEMAADLVSSPIYLFLGPRFGFMSMFLFSAMGAVLLIVFWSDVSVVPVFIMMTKFGISACFNMVFIAQNELFPTLYVASAFGYCNVVARSISVMSTLCAKMEFPTPLVILIILATIAAVVSLFIIPKLPKFKLKQN